MSLLTDLLSLDDNYSDLVTELKMLRDRWDTHENMRGEELRDELEVIIRRHESKNTSGKS
jgi:hypothetical protein